MTLGAAAPSLSAQAASFKLLYTFTGGTDGANPAAGLIINGHQIYGTTTKGGTNNNGIAYSVSMDGVETVLHLFNYHDGNEPEAGMIRDGEGNLFGTTYLGGANGFGEVYKLAADHTLTVVHSFDDGDGAQPSTPLLLQGGTLYGTAIQGGEYGSGAIFSVGKSGKRFTLLYSLGGPDHLGDPSGPLTPDKAGNFYGVAAGGGLYQGGGIFKLSRQAKMTVLYNFTGGNDGCDPRGNLILDARGDLYGTALKCGNYYSAGAIFKLSATGQERTLYEFTGGSDGAGPVSLLRDASGNIYGSTVNGGTITTTCTLGCGTIFEIPSGGKEEVLYTFTGESDGWFPGPISFNGAHKIVGATQLGGAHNAGTVFSLTF